MIFTVVKFAGALYLIYLGTRFILGSFGTADAENAEQPRIRKNAQLQDLLTRGFITLTNPKVLLFFVSFFPQFVVPGGDHQAESFLILGLAYTLVAFLTDAMFALLAGSAVGVVSRNRRLQNLLDRIVGITFIGLGIRLSLTHR